VKEALDVVGLQERIDPDLQVGDVMILPGEAEVRQEISEMTHEMPRGVVRPAESVVIEMVAATGGAASILIQTAVNAEAPVVIPVGERVKMTKK